jgi:ABC-type transport system involved in multi-copper enzyme maturation permease subunit
MNVSAPMKSEILKLRALPMPRAILAVCLASTAIVALIVFVVQPRNPDVYRDAPATMTMVAVAIGSIVFGAWAIGVDFAQDTLRRTLIAEPRRGSILLNKFALIVVAVVPAAVLCALFAMLVGKLTALASTVDFDQTAAFKDIAATALQALLTALLAGALTLLLRSFTGGLISAFVLLFVIDGVLQLSSAIRDYTFGAALGDVRTAIAGDAPHHLGLAAAVLVALAWIAAIGVPAAARFVRADFK